MTCNAPRVIAFLLVSYSLLANEAFGDTITFRGTITQATQDGSGPAVNNPSLNNISDGDGYAVTLAFAGPITAPGFYDLTGSSFGFSDSTAAASESSFDAISLSIAVDGASYDISILGCLTTGSFGCSGGNQLDASFAIPAAMLNAIGVAATGLDQPHPLDLLEDDGITDIHGSITSYSYTVSPVPEPSSLLLLAAGMVTFAARKTRIPTRRKTHE